MCQYYISTKELAPNEFAYGTLCVVEKKPFEIDTGVTKGNVLEVNEELTRRIIERNKKNVLSTGIMFKYDSLEIAKHMVFQFEHDKKYQEYARDFHGYFSASPSVFLSDMENKNTLSKAIDKQVFAYNYYTKQKKGKSR